MSVLPIRRTVRPFDMPNATQVHHISMVVILFVTCTRRLSQRLRFGSIAYPRSSCVLLLSITLLGFSPAGRVRAHFGSPTGFSIPGQYGHVPRTWRRRLSHRRRRTRRIHVQRCLYVAMVRERLRPRGKRRCPWCPADRERDIVATCHRGQFDIDGGTRRTR